MTLQFDAVLARTDRRELPEGCIRKTFETGVLDVRGLWSGEWSEGIDPAELKAAVVHFDLLSTFLTERKSVPDARAAVGEGWAGLRWELPQGMVGGDFRVRLQVTVALPADHPRAGFILARSPEIVLVEGPPTEGGKSSLLPVRPSDQVRGLHEIQIDEQQGPVLLVNSEISGMSWKKIASDAHFQLVCLEGCLRLVFTHLVLHREDLPGWAERWLELPGAKGHDMPEPFEGDVVEILGAAQDWAAETARRCCSAMELVERFRSGLGVEESE